MFFPDRHTPRDRTAAMALDDLRTPRRARTAARKKPAAAPKNGDVQTVYERISAAIMVHGLPPGTRLVESRLCEIFGLGRTRIRQVLQRLANERLVTLLPNRGALVCKPSVREAREVFEREYLLAQINRFGGNISRTANFVGMERSALHRKLKQLGIGAAEDKVA
jgi:DNA-binding NtrC family response regulator